MNSAELGRVKTWAANYQGQAHQYVVRMLAHIDAQDREIRALRRYISHEDRLRADADLTFIRAMER